MPGELKEFGYLFFGEKGGQMMKIEGSIRVPDLESARDTVRLVMMRDSRLMQGFVLDPKTHERLWAAVPGVLREEMVHAGFGPDLLKGPMGILK